MRLHKLCVRVLGLLLILGLVHLLWHFAAPLDKRRALGVPVLVHLLAAVVLRQVVGVDALEQHWLPLLDVCLEDLDFAQRVLVEELLNDVEGERKDFGGYVGRGGGVIVGKG